MNRGVSEQEAAALRITIRERLTAAQRESQQTGRPLHILVGEEHSSYRSFVGNMLITSEAQRLGIRNLNLEMPANQLGTLPATAGLETLQLMPTLFSSMRTQAIDSAYNTQDRNENFSPSGIQRRDAAMATRIASQTGGSISLVGGLHLQGISQHPALRNGVVVNFNTTQGTLEGLAPHLQARDLFASNPQNALQISPRGDAREMSLHQAATVSLGERQAAPALAKLESRGVINSPERLRQTANQLASTDPNTLSIPQGILAYRVHRDLAATEPNNTTHATRAGEFFNNIQKRVATQHPQIAEQFAHFGNEAPSNVRNEIGNARSSGFLDGLRNMFSNQNFPTAPASPAQPVSPNGPGQRPPDSTDRPMPNR